jgi:RHH-type proline utilization regulon transcriptional repressor/proline dehydrogenase/delta 1-pyrroline-5-carboxylate dehydrogenase
LAYIEAVAESLGLAPETWEYQMIFGMAEPFQHAVLQQGRRLRLYAPVGDLLPGMAYLVRRLLENTSNESFLRKEYVESQSLSTLLAPPVLEGLSQKQPAHPADFRNESQRNFSQAASREAMQQALARVRLQLCRQWMSAGGLHLTGPLIESRNPGRPDEVVGRFSSASPEDVDQAVRWAVQTRESWRDISTERRVKILHAAAALMRSRRDGGKRMRISRKRSTF